MWPYYFDEFYSLACREHLPADGRYIPKRSTVIKNKRRRKR